MAWIPDPIRELEARWTRRNTTTCIDISETEIRKATLIIHLRIQNRNSYE